MHWIASQLLNFKRFSAKILYYFLNKSTTGIHFSIENVDPHQPHLYIANHRDIVLIPPITNIPVPKQLSRYQSAIGDNLISDLFVELARINNMMLVYVLPIYT